MIQLIIGEGLKKGESDCKLQVCVCVCVRLQSKSGGVYRHLYINIVLQNVTSKGRILLVC